MYISRLNLNSYNKININKNFTKYIYFGNIFYLKNFSMITVKHEISYTLIFNFYNNNYLLI